MYSNDEANVAKFRFEKKGLILR